MAEAIKYFILIKVQALNCNIIIVTIIVRLIILPLGSTNHGRQPSSEKDECPQTCQQATSNTPQRGNNSRKKKIRGLKLSLTPEEHGIMFGGGRMFPHSNAALLCYLQPNILMEYLASWVSISVPQSMILVAFAGILYYLQSSFHFTEQKTRCKEINSRK